MLLPVPILSLLLVWWMFAAGFPSKLPIGVIDEQPSAMTRQLQRMFDASQGLQIHAHYTDMIQAEQAMRRGEVAAVVVMPRGMEADIKRQRATAVTLLHNAQWSSFSGLIQRDVRTTVGTLSAGIEITQRQARGQTPTQARQGTSPIRSQMVTLFNPSGNYQRFLAAPVLPALLLIFACMAGAWSMGRMFRDASADTWMQQVLALPEGTGHAQLGLDRWLAATAGKAVAMLVPMAACATVALALIGTRVDADTGAWLVTALALGLMLALGIGMGMLFSAVTLSLRTGLSLSALISAPAFAFSGVAFPLLAMPDGARLWAQMLPSTHYLALQIKVLDMKAPLALSLPTLGAMALVTALLLMVCSLALRRGCTRPARWGAR